MRCTIMVDWRHFTLLVGVKMGSVMPETDAGFGTDARKRLGRVAGFDIVAGLAIMLATVLVGMPRAVIPSAFPCIWRQAQSSFH